MVTIQLARYVDVEAFERRVGPFLSAREAEHNLMFGIMASLRDSDRYTEPAYLACVDDGQEVVAVAMRTPPFGVILSEMSDLGALDSLVPDLHEVYGTLPNVQGSKPVVSAFIERWQAQTGQCAHLEVAQRIYRLEQVSFDGGVPGEARKASHADRDLLVRWFEAFEQDAFGSITPGQAEKSVNHFLASTTATVLLWWDEGRAVSLAVSKGPTPNGIRIGPVYTPPEQRGHGYASACTATLSQMMLDAGYRYCFLYTDLGNPTSNSIYQKIGYRPVIDIDRYIIEG